MGVTAAFLVTALLTPVVARAAVQLGIVDRPGPLKLQREPIPYLGGMAVAAGLLGPVAIAWPKALLPLGLALALGLADDRAALSLNVRLPCEFAIGVAAVLVVPGLQPLSGTVLVVGLVLLINATNLLDGLDGLASGTVAVGAVGFAFVSVEGPDVLALALMGALAGFLLWNRPPASIFLGDAGSYLLGTALALLLASMTRNDELGLSRSTGALLFIAAPMADTIVAIVRRWRAGQPLVRGDRGHIYDQLLARGISGPHVTWLFIGAQAILVAIGLAITRLPSETAFLATGGVIAVVSSAVLWMFTNPNAAWSDRSPVVDVLGTAVRIEVPYDHRDELNRLVAALETGAPATRVMALVKRPEGSLDLHVDGAEVISGIEPEVAIATVIWRLNDLAAQAEDYLVIHAGCVARHQRAVILPGRSGAGKSELTATCITHGFQYLSDEQAALDLRTGLLSPYAKPLSLREGVIPPASLGALHPASPTAPAAIVFPHYDAHVGAPTQVRLSPAMTLLALCAHSQKMGRAGFLRLAGIALACPAWDATYAHSADGLRMVREALNDSEAPATVRAARPLSTGSRRSGLTPVAFDDEIVIYRPETESVHHLNRSASFVWSHGDVAAGDELVQVVLDAAPPGALDEAVVSATVTWLTDAGLLAPPDRSGTSTETGSSSDGPSVGT